MNTQESARTHRRTRLRKPSTAFYLGLAFAALALVFLLSSRSMPEGDGDPGPGFVPIIVSSLALGLLAIVLFRELFGRASQPEDVRSAEPKVVWKQLVFIVLLFLYYVCLPLVGFLASTVVFLVIVFRMFGVQGVVKPLASASIVTAAIYLTFVELFKIPLSAL